MIYIKILAVLALIGSIVWFIVDPGFEPALSIILSLSSLISALIVEKRISHRLQQKQVISKSSTGIQAGGDVNIGNIRGDKNGK